MKKQINIATQQIIFTFDELPAVTLDVSKVSDDVLEYAQYHGLQARIGDNAAIARKQGDTIITVTEAMRRDAVQELVTHYESGSVDWRPSRSNRIWPAMAYSSWADCSSTSIVFVT